MSEKTIVPLSVPITGPDGLISEIELRVPTCADIRRIGSPFKTDPSDPGALRDDRVMEYVSRLGNIPPSTADKIAACDYLELMMAVAYFFTPSQEEKSM